MCIRDRDNIYVTDGNNHRVQKFSEGFTTFSDGTSTTTSATVTGLSGGKSYEFKVAAVNADGTGSYSSVVTGHTTEYIAGHEFSGHQSFDAGKKFGAGTKFAENQDFSVGTMIFNGAQEFGSGTKFASGQDLSGGTHTFSQNIAVSYTHLTLPTIYSV